MTDAEHDAWLFKLQDERGKVNKMKETVLRRLITALDVAQNLPDGFEKSLITERLEESIKDLKKPTP